MRIKVMTLGVALIFFLCQCGNNCEPFEDFGDIRLEPKSVELLSNIIDESTAVFLDTFEREYNFKVLTSTEYEEYNERCDSNNDRIINSEEPIDRSYRFEKRKVRYSLDSLFTVNLSLSVEFYGRRSGNTLQDHLDAVVDQLSIFLTDTPEAGLTFSWIYNYRNRETMEPLLLVKHLEEITLGNKIFYDVYYDDRYLDIGNGFITYFNKEFGLIGIVGTRDNLFLYLDRVE